TRSYGDWSSDVCSSDLQGFSRLAKADLAANIEGVFQVNEHWGLGLSVDAPGFATNYPSDDLFTRKSEVQAAGMELVARVVWLPRSEERRVGKEWRARRW